MSTNLFAQARQRTSGALVEFKAGRMYVEQGMVKPDKRKGKIVMIRGDDGLLHFQWRLRDDKNTLIDDLILFPEEAKWKRVDKIQKSRIYYLDFIGTNRQVFFWLQEPKEDEDEAIAKKINELLEGKKTQPPTSEQETLFNMFSEARHHLQPRSQPTSQLQIDQLQRVLQSLSAQTSQQSRQQAGQQTGQQTSQQTSQQAGQQTSQQEPKQEGPGLRDILRSEHVCASVMKHDDIVTELIEYLPSNTPKNVYALCEHIRSPQFQQAVATFDAALSSGQLSGLMQSIGLDPSVGGPFGGTQQFVNALQKQADEKEKKKEKKEEKKDDDKMEE